MAKLRTMQKDFSIGQSNELIKDGRIYDLHNSFDFESLVVSGCRDIRLVFKPNVDHGKTHSRIAVQIQSVDYFEISPQFGASIICDIDEVGYKFREDRDDSWLLTENQANEAADMFVRFQGGHHIRFHGGRALLVDLPLCSDPDSPPQAFGG